MLIFAIQSRCLASSMITKAWLRASIIMLFWPEETRVASRARHFAERRFAARCAVQPVTMPPVDVETSFCWTALRGATRRSGRNVATCGCRGGCSLDGRPRRRTRANKSDDLAPQVVLANSWRKSCDLDAEKTSVTVRRWNKQHQRPVFLSLWAPVCPLLIPLIWLWLVSKNMVVVARVWSRKNATLTTQKRISSAFLKA